MFKRLFDIASSSSGLIAISPFLVAISALIKAEDGGPVFYRGVRVGKDGKPFRIFKFRTMVVDAEQRGGPSTSDDDPRITKIGKILRKYKLDELPQLLNVLKGEMSIVGPRPEVEQYVDLYTDEEKAILKLRPGITDWASIWNPDEGALLAGNPDPEKAYLEKIRPEKIRLQLEYVKQHSLLTDLEIISKTLLTLLKRSGKNEQK